MSTKDQTTAKKTPTMISGIHTLGLDTQGVTVGVIVGI